MAALSSADCADQHTQGEAQVELTRRTILKALFGSGLAAGGASAGMLQLAPAVVTETVLRAFLDTLIPADDLTPGASALGITPAVLAMAEGKSYGRLIDQGCVWLDRQARARFHLAFAELAEGPRITVVRVAENARQSSLENVFFRAVRDDVIGRYYADPRVWPSLGYAGPPQPVGFPDFAHPPAASMSRSTT